MKEKEVVETSLQILLLVLFVINSPVLLATEIPVFGQTVLPPKMVMRFLSVFSTFCQTNTVFVRPNTGKYEQKRNGMGFQVEGYFSCSPSSLFVWPHLGVHARLRIVAIGGLQRRSEDLREVTELHR